MNAQGTRPAVVNPYLKKVGSHSRSQKAQPTEQKEEARVSTELNIQDTTNHPQIITTAPLRPIQQKQQRGEDVPIEQRLPSRIVSFQSAEHLTVTELREFLAYYMNRSVRITGVILHRHVVESDASVCLVLGNPLVPKKTTSRRSIGGTTPRKATPSKQATTPSSVVTNLGPVQTPSNRKGDRRTPLLGSKRKLVHVPRGSTPSSTLGSGNKRKLVHVPKSTPRNSLLSSGKRRNSFSNNKRRLSFSSPTESAINCLMNQETVLAIVDPLQHPHVADCGVGDVVMLVGEVAVAAQDTAKAFVLQYRKRLERNDENDVRYLVPRILRNVNGTNVRLQYEALLKRRNHILQLSNDPHQPGRGPPRTKDAPPV